MRVYRALLHLYPASFRREYGDEMATIFRERLRDAGPAAAAGLWFAALGEIVAGAAAVHWDMLRQDLQYALRTMRRAPGFTATAILLVALGIGANTAAFSVADFVLLRPLPFPEPDRLVKLWQRMPDYSRFELSPENYRDWKRSSRSFESMGAFWTNGSNLYVAGSEPERLTGASVSWDLFPTLGVQPALGRGFTAEEDTEGADGRVILSHGLWRTLFAGDPAVLGRQITLDDEPHVVVGVMPPAFTFPSRDTEFWRPLRLSLQDTDRTNTFLQVVARLKPGVTIEQAREDVGAIAAQLAAQFPKENGETSAAVIGLRDEVPRQSRLLLLALSGAALCVLLIACANLANLLIARAMGRRREMAVRTAIGAGRDRLVRQLATESALLAAVGGCLGIALAHLAVPLLGPLAPASVPVPGEPSIDPRVLGFAVVLTALTAFGFGVLPALRIGRDADAAGLRDGARGTARREHLRGALVIVEVVASVVLLVNAGLLIRALWTIQNVNPGFRADGVLTMRTTPAWPKYAPTEKRAAFYTEVLSAVRALPGVTDAAYSSGLPMVTRGGIWTVEIRGDEGTGRSAERTVSLRYVTPGFFQTLGIPVTRGRDVADSDTGNTTFVAVVSESFARRHWPGENPIGRRFSVAFFERTIVGVVADIRVRGLEADSEPQVYMPYRQIPDGYMPTYAPKDLAVRASLPADQLVPSVRAIIRRADPYLPVSDVRMLTEIVDQETASRAGQVRVLGLFAAVAVLLAAVGIHGLLAFAVSQRTQEFGVRMALGAHPAEIARMVLRQGALLAAAGLVPGLVLAYAAGRLLHGLLAGVSPADPSILAGVALLITAVALAGCLTPALRAFRVNAVEALRAEG